MPSSGPFVVRQAGACSFCREDCAGVRILVGVPTREATLCDSCVALAWDILADDLYFDEPGDHPGSVCFDVAAPDERRFRERIDAMARRLAGERAARGAAATAGQSSVWAARAAQQRSLMPGFTCSFCDSHRADVVKLIFGPGASICDACIESGTAVIVDERSARERV